MKIVVGLGNIGKEYEKTNHNAGFRVVDKVADHYSEKFSKKECDAEVSSFFINGEKVILAKPTTFMNNSGISVKQLVNKYKIDVKNDLIVVADDFDIEIGKIKIKNVSGNTTHNGIKSIKSELKTNEFIRIKSSIGKIPEFLSTADFVLSKVKDERTTESEEKSANAIIDLLEGLSLQKVMQKYNS